MAITLDQLRDAGGVLASLTSAAAHRVVSGEKLTMAETKTFVQAVKEAGADVAHGKPAIVPKETYEARSAICKACDVFDPIKGQCVRAKGGCGCYMPAKAKLARASCPLGKWQRWTA